MEHGVNLCEMSAESCGMLAIAGCLRTLPNPNYATNISCKHTVKKLDSFAVGNTRHTGLQAVGLRQIGNKHCVGGHGVELSDSGRAVCRATWLAQASDVLVATKVHMVFCYAGWGRMAS